MGGDESGAQLGFVRNVKKIKKNEETPLTTYVHQRILTIRNISL
jgi:hypothetical protein